MGGVIPLALLSWALIVLYPVAMIAAFQLALALQNSTHSL